MKSAQVILIAAVFAGSGCGRATVAQVQKPQAQSNESRGETSESDAFSDSPVVDNSKHPLDGLWKVTKYNVAGKSLMGNLDYRIVEIEDSIASLVIGLVTVTETEDPNSDDPSNRQVQSQNQDVTLKFALKKLPQVEASWTFVPTADLAKFGIQKKTQEEFAKAVRCDLDHDSINVWVNLRGEELAENPRTGTDTLLVKLERGEEKLPERPSTEEVVQGLDPDKTQFSFLINHPEVNRPRDKIVLLDVGPGMDLFDGDKRFWERALDYVENQFDKLAIGQRLLVVLAAEELRTETFEATEYKKFGQWHAENLVSRMPPTSGIEGLAKAFGFLAREQPDDDIEIVVSPPVEDIDPEHFDRHLLPQMIGLKEQIRFIALTPLEKLPNVGISELSSSDHLPRKGDTMGYHLVLENFGEERTQFTYEILLEGNVLQETEQTLEGNLQRVIEFEIPGNKWTENPRELSVRINDLPHHLNSNRDDDQITVEIKKRSPVSILLVSGKLQARESPYLQSALEAFQTTKNGLSLDLEVVTQDQFTAGQCLFKDLLIFESMNSFAGKDVRLLQEIIEKERPALLVCLDPDSREDVLGLLKPHWQRTFKRIDGFTIGDQQVIPTPEFQRTRFGEDFNPFLDEQTGGLTTVASFSHLELQPGLHKTLLETSAGNPLLIQAEQNALISAFPWDLEHTQLVSDWKFLMFVEKAISQILDTDDQRLTARVGQDISDSKEIVKGFVTRRSSENSIIGERELYDLASQGTYKQIGTYTITRRTLGGTETIHTVAVLPSSRLQNGELHWQPLQAFCKENNIEFATRPSAE